MANSWQNPHMAATSVKQGKEPTAVLRLLQCRIASKHCHQMSASFAVEKCSLVLGLMDRRRTRKYGCSAGMLDWGELDRVKMEVDHEPLLLLVRKTSLQLRKKKMTYGAVFLQDPSTLLLCACLQTFGPKLLKYQMLRPTLGLRAMHNILNVAFKICHMQRPLQRR